ncbi:ATP-binding protein [Candidatus Pacearchaeota archaeon]|nr:ATP-binding protein [Candidatus Pacearchaeota archaeon]
MVEKRDILRGYLSRIITSTLELCNQKIRNIKTGQLLPSRSFLLKPIQYANKFAARELKQRILVFPGLRGIGKTTILFQTYKYFLDNLKIPPENLLYLDVGEIKNIHGASLNELFSVYEENFLRTNIENFSKPIILFLDEAHNDSSWMDFALSLFNRSDGYSNVLIYVTGSSALALGGGVDLSRRMIRDIVYPLTFQEYLLLKNNFFPPKSTAEKIRIALGSEIESAEYILSNVYLDLKKKFDLSKMNLSKELENYLSTGASPISLTETNENFIFKWWVNIFEKVIKQDIPNYSPLGTQSSNKVFAMLQYLAESLPPAHRSIGTISKELENMPEGTVFNIFKALKTACLIQEVEPFVSVLKRTAKSSKYYFQHPTIRAALLWHVGKFNVNDNSLWGVMLEEMISFTIISNVEKPKSPILYVGFDDSKSGADFVIKTPNGNVAIECSWGSKGATQVEKTMERVDCKFGIVLCNRNSVERKEKVLFVPKELFLFF